MSVGLVCNVGILIVSDTCFYGEKVDTCGPHIENLLTSQKLAGVVRRVCVPDEMKDIQEMLLQWCDYNRLDLIFTLGGTGFGLRDVTPEATKSVLSHELEYLSSAMILGCRKKAATSILSRSVCGIRGETLIINFPGSLKASQECFEEIAPVIIFAVNNLKKESPIDSFHHERCEDSYSGNFRSRSKVDISNVAERPRQSGYSMVIVSCAVNIILQHSVALNIKRKNFRDCFNHILAENIVAKEPFPLFPASIKDGYAVIAEDRSEVRNVIGNATPGYLPDCSVSYGTCVRVSTGGAIPNGANAVIQVEDTVVVEKDKEGKEELKIKITKFPALAEDIRGVGSDIAEGEILIDINKKVSAADIGIMSMCGILSALVYEKPWVAVLSTGNEILEPESPLKPGCIHDSNKSSLMHILYQCCIPAVDLGIVKDNPNDVKSRLMLAFETADVIVSTGGVSMGEMDCLKEVLKVDFDAIIHFGRIHMKPGKPTTFSTVNFNGKTKLVFSLPGNPVSAFVTFHLFVIPCLRKLMGFTNPENKVIKVRMSHELKLDERPEYHRASINYCNETLTYLASSTGNQRSSRLPSMVCADALLVLPPRTTQQTIIPKGSRVDAILLEGI